MTHELSTPFPKSNFEILTEHFHLVLLYEVYIFSQYGNKFILNIILLQTFSESKEQNQKLWNSFNWIL